MKKRFIVRKYIMANSALDAIKLDKISPVDDVWIDEDWKKEYKNNMGFKNKRSA